MPGTLNMKDNGDKTHPPRKDPGLKINDSIYGVRYLGCAADLISTGVVRPDQLPGTEGPRKKSAVYYGGVAVARGRKYPQDEHYMEIVLLRPDRFSVWSPHSREVRMAREEVETLQAASEHERRKVKEAAAHELSKIPPSREAYRRSQLARLDGLLDLALFTVQESEKHGFSLEQNAVQEMRAAAGKMRSALSGGVINFDAPRHERVVSMLSAAAGVPIKNKARLHLVGSSNREGGG